MNRFKNLDVTVSAANLRSLVGLDILDSQLVDQPSPQLLTYWSPSHGNSS
jgi:hypothetical protein